jgi:putative serine protease PepD
MAEVESGSPAAKGGVRQGDLITELDGGAIDSTEAPAAAIAEREPDEKVTLEIERDSESIALEIRLGSQPADSDLIG